VTLEQVYIALDTTEKIITGSEHDHPKVAFREEAPLTALDAATENKRVVILGDPGGGKPLLLINWRCYWQRRV
jgi:hypothetical protein